MKLPDEARLKRGRAAIISCQRQGCDICLKACGFTAISVDENGFAYSDPSKCVGCGGCVAICPDMAVRLIKDRFDGTYEHTLAYRGALPEIGEEVLASPLTGGEEAPCRVIQALPKRPAGANALVRVVMNSI